MQHGSPSWDVSLANAVIRPKTPHIRLRPRELGPNMPGLRPNGRCSAHGSADNVSQCPFPLPGAAPSPRTRRVHENKHPHVDNAPPSWSPHVAKRHMVAPV